MPSNVLAPAVLLCSLALCAPATAQSQLVTTTAPQNVVSLSASATLEVQQDELTLVFAATRDGADPAAVQSQLKQALEAALTEARKAARPGQLEVNTGRFSLSPRYSPRGGISGWIGSAELVVVGRDIAAVSQLAGRIGTMPLARTSFSLSRDARQKAEAEVMAQAIARFKGRAEQVAREFGFGGWSLREVSVQGQDGMHPAPVMRAQAMRAAAPDEALPVEAGRTQVTVTVGGSVQLSPR